MTKDDVIDKFGNLVKIARNSGINALNDYISGKRLKNPPEDVAQLFALIESLSESQKQQLTESVKFLMDISFFKLLTLMEVSEMPFQIELNVITDEQKIPLINSEEDNELRSKYWNWIKK